MIENIRAAYVIARRDFTAIIFSKSFFFFLLGPLFPLLIGLAAGSLGAQVSEDIDQPVIGLALEEDEAAKLVKARAALARKLGSGSLPELLILTGVSPSDPDIKSKLNTASRPLTAIISGSLEAPLLTGSQRDVKRWSGKVALLAETALSAPQPVMVEVDFVADTDSSEKRAQLGIAQGGQVILIVLTMILAGMVLS